MVLRRIWGSTDGAVARALAFHQCVPGSIPGPGVICGLSLLLVLFLAPRGFSPGTLVFPSPQKTTFPNCNYIRSGILSTLYHEPLARVIAQALPVFDIKFTFTFTFTTLAPTYEARMRRSSLYRNAFYAGSKAQSSKLPTYLAKMDDVLQGSTRWPVR